MSFKEHHTLKKKSVSYEHAEYNTNISRMKNVYFANNWIVLEMSPALWDVKEMNIIIWNNCVFLWM